MKKSILAILATVAAFSASAATKKTFNDKEVLTIDTDTTWNGTTGQSAIDVPSGRTAVINIKKGVTLTVYGADADGTACAVPAIYVPQNATLYITGEGTLVANGGNAANGANGEKGYDASRDGDDHTRGWACDGGNGGGGAAAGIGGEGGKGADGGEEGYRGSSHDAGDNDDFPGDGAPGGAGGDGASGAPCGSVYILGNVTVKAIGGSAGAAGSPSSWGENCTQDAQDFWASGGGGSGGGGGGGGRAMAIGGGGGGGGAGGGGGSGSYVVVDNDNTYKASNIDGGKGGDGKGGLVGGGSGSGEPESSTEHNNYKEDTHPISKTGAGAAGNAGYAQGAGGKVVVLPTAAIACSPSCTVDSGAGLPQEQFLSVTMTLDFGLTEGGSAKQIQVAQPFACKMVTLLDEAKVKRAGYRFAGYWTDDGTCVYGPDYKATMVMSPYVEDYTLYARWEIDSSILSITSSGDGASTLDVYGNEAITLRDAVNALVANPLLVGEDGRRRVTFEKLDSTNRVIKLAGEIAIPAGARSFEVNGLCELVPGEKGVELVAGANSRHFNFKGASSDDGGMFSLANLTLTGGKGDNGGSLLLSGASISIDNCAFLGNEASNYGGAICLMAKSTNYLLVASTTFAGNSANHGGALRLQGDGNAAFFTTIVIVF